MGGGFYFSSARSTRAEDEGYYTKSRDDIFTQNRSREMHELMDPSQAILREARDSEEHPNSLPIILGLDFTGSMGHIPHELIKDGLPTLMGGIVEKDGISDAQLLFLGIGDHECDACPLQVGQFESSDELIDGWLTKSYIEGGGGGNAGESYLLAWYFAAMHIETDAWEKRQEKGFLFTIGDEPGLSNLPANAINNIMKNGNQVSYTDVELLEMVQEKYNVYHIDMGYERGRSNDYWSELLGENHIVVDRHNSNVAEKIREIISENYNPDSAGNVEEGAINFGV